MQVRSETRNMKRETLRGMGVVLRQRDKGAVARLGKLGLQSVVAGDWTTPWLRTLFVGPEAIVPWDLLGAGFHFIERWDAAAPLWRYGVLAADVGAPAERTRTQKCTLDLRMLLYAPDLLLFVRAAPPGRSLLETWRAECERGADERLAFLRALHQIKPTFCALPRSWLGDIEQRQLRDAETLARQRAARVDPLIKIEIAPGRYVKCRAGQEEEARRLVQQRQGRRQK